MRTPLPIDARLGAIVDVLRGGRNLVVVAEPGAGKTTRVPRALLDAGYGERGEIVVLEPRRIAARLSAERVAEELDERVGERVGYQVRFERRTSGRTRILFLTEGLLSRRLADDPLLRGTSVLVFDEFHERNVHGDLGLAMVRRAQASRPELRIVVMSATLDAARVATYLDAEVMNVEGRTFPVEVEYEKAGDDRPLERRVVGAARALIASTEGDVLVFLPGAGEIRRAADAAATLAREADLDLVPLHGELPPAEQDRAVRPSPRRRLVLATNVAETSITLPSVTAVVDSGLARVAKHSPFSGLPSLEVARISQSSAVQRAGRAGRVRAGRAMRLYTRHDFDARPRFDEPEIRRMDLCEVALLLASAGEDARRFPYFEAPSDAAVGAAIDVLTRLEALGPEGRITRLGRELLRLPIHPRLARMTLAAADGGVGPRGALMAALLGERDVLLATRTAIGGARHETDEIGASDLLARVERIERAEDEGLDRRTLDALGLDGNATRSALRVRGRLVSMLGVNERPVVPIADEEELLLRATLAGFPDRLGRRRAPRSDQIVFASGGSATLSPGSVVKRAEFVVAVDAQKGARGVELRLASAIEPEWLLEREDGRLRELKELRFDPATEQVEQRTALLYDAMVLDESVRRDVEGPEVEAVLARAALDAGLQRFWDRDALEALRMRLAFAARHGLGIEAPDDASLERGVRRLCVGARSFADLRGSDLTGALVEELPPGARSRLDAFAPTHVAIAGRPKVPLTYTVDGAPYLESRLQDFFGTVDGPRVADGRVPVVLHLLAPNQRAVQVTTDLAGFWDRHYPSVRRELQRQYPRHAWPEDPRTAEPSRPKPRPRS